MKHQSLKSGWLLWGRQWLLSRGMVLVFRRDLGSDRIRRIPFSGIRQVAATTTFPALVAALSAFLLILGIAYAAAGSAEAGAFCAIPAAIGLLLCITRKRSVIDIRSGADSARIRVLWLSSRKRGAFLAALLAGVEREQGQAVLRNGAPFETESATR